MRSKEFRRVTIVARAAKNLHRVRIGFSIDPDP